jgi:PAS domain S-box-containing protein
MIVAVPPSRLPLPLPRKETNPMAGATILIVEDECVVGLDIKRTLERLGYTVLAVVASGEAAIQQAAETQPDLVLMDIKLRGAVDGLEAAERIRARFDTPVVFLTAYVDDVTLQRAQASESFGYLLKPFEEGVLHTTIEMALFKHKMERRLKESEEKYRLLVENANEAIVVVQDGMLKFLNPKVVEIIGYSREELASLPLIELIHPVDRDLAHKNYLRCLNGEETSQMCAFRVIHKRGNIRWLESNAVVITWEGRLATLSFLTDITERRQAEVENACLYAEVQQRLDELTTLNKISQAVNSSLDLQEILTLVTDHSTRLLGMAATSVALRDRGDLWFAAASGEAAEFVRGKRLAMGQGIVGKVAQGGEPALVPDVSQDSRFCSSFDEESGFTTRSVLCVPLQVQGRTIGAIEAINNKDVVFKEEDLALLTSLAAPVATAIENARLHAETEHRAEQLAVLHELDRAITTSLRITDVYQALACHAGRLLSYDHLSITMIEENRARVAYVTDRHNDSLSAGITLSLQTSSVGWVTARGQPLLRHNITSDSRFSGDQKLLVDGIESVMVIPLRVKARVIGTCNIGSRQVGAYSPDDLAAAQLMADMLAVAIENARLFEAEQCARQTAEILRAANLAFTQTLDLDAVLEALLDYLGQFVPYDRARVLLVEDDARIVVRATRGFDDGQSCVATEETQANPINYTVLTTRKSLLIPDTYEHPGWECCVGEEHMRGLIGVPLVANGQVIGLCTLETTQARFFAEQHQSLAESLTAQAAIAIQNARLFEQVRVGRERLQTLSRRLVEVQESERRHIARELHDQAGQTLSSLMVGLRLLEEAADDNKAVVAHIAGLKDTIDSVLESLHQLATDLRPASLDHLGLVAALRQHAEVFSRQHDLAVQFETVGLEGERLSPTVETALYRIVQEALNNVVRHAQATRADVLLERQGNRVISIVEDDGIGFDLVAAMQSGRLGLLGVQERAEMLGGTLVVESTPGAGTTLVVEVPYVHSYSDC